MSARSLLVRSLPCIACHLDAMQQPFPSEEHHLNLGGRAGQKRIGDDHSVPLCGWHHRGVALIDLTLGQMALLYGPSLARQSKRFRQIYGTDDQLLAMTNEQLQGVA